MMTACVDMMFVLSWVPLIVIVAGGVILFGACIVVEWDRHLAAKERRAAMARRRWSGMNRNDR